MSIYLWYILFVIFVTNGTIVDDEEEQLQDRLRTIQYKDLCTRRFTPGVCIEPIMQVWTFHFQVMNCTERLGCPQSTRSNRFSTYERCMKRCQPMVDLYLQILAYGGDSNSRFFLRKIPDPKILRKGLEYRFPPPAPEEDYYPGDEALLARVMYPDRRAGLDDVPDGRDVDDYLELHDPAA